MPTLLGTCTAAGLLAALLGEARAWLWFSWAALLLPVIAIGYFALKRRSAKGA